MEQDVSGGHCLIKDLDKREFFCKGGKKSKEHMTIVLLFECCWGQTN